MPWTRAKSAHCSPFLSNARTCSAAGVAPASKPMLDAIQRFTDHLTNDPGELYKHTHTDFDAARAAYAALIGADVDEIAVTDSTGTGSNLSVEMIDPPPGSNVVFDELSYPSAVYPWMLPPRQHVDRRFVKMRDGLVQLDDLAEAIDDNTIAVSISHVSQTTGFRYDLGAVAALAHEHGALLLVDAMQSAGAIRIDVHEMGVDFLSTGAMKWLLGSAGVGFFYVARRHLDRMPPHAGGQGAIQDTRPLGEQAFRPKPGADRFHIGMPNMMGLAATTPGLEILAAVGIDRHRGAHPGPDRLLHRGAQGARTNGANTGGAAASGGHRCDRAGRRRRIGLVPDRPWGGRLLPPTDVPGGPTRV